MRHIYNKNIYISTGLHCTSLLISIPKSFQLVSSSSIMSLSLVIVVLETRDNLIIFLFLSDLNNLEKQVLKFGNLHRQNGNNPYEGKFH